ncbi:MAG: hypothetical protein K5765_03995 [Clostridia bacterium]|nr:hypothetical protein [Clostridia bacterium]
MLSDSIEKKINEIIEKQKELIKNIDELKNLIREENLSKCYNEDNKNLFGDFLSNEGKKETSIKAYYEGLERIKLYLKEYNLLDLDNEIYYIDDLNLLNTVLSAFNDSAEITYINLKHHHMYSAALNNYVRFLKILK